MVDATDLAYLAGAPFTDEEIDAAIATVRAAVGWHVAPVQTDTVALNVDCRKGALRLPTRKLVSVDEIRDTNLNTVIDAATYRALPTLCEVIRRGGYWPSGYERIQVDMTHGYDEWPLDLWAVIAEAATMSRRDQSITQQTAGAFTVGYGAAAVTPLSTGGALDRYMLIELGAA